MRKPLSWLRYLVPIGIMLVMLVSLVRTRSGPSRPAYRGWTTTHSESLPSYPVEGPVQNFLTDRP